MILREVRKPKNGTIGFVRVFAFIPKTLVNGPPEKRVSKTIWLCYYIQKRRWSMNLDTWIVADEFLIEDMNRFELKEIMSGSDDLKIGSNLNYLFLLEARRRGMAKKYPG